MFKHLNFFRGESVNFLSGAFGQSLSAISPGAQNQNKNITHVSEKHEEIHS